MANNIKEIDGIQTTDDTIPASSTLTPTITASSGGNAFSLSAADSQVTANAWIFDNTSLTKTDWKLYKVKSVNAAGTSGTIWGTFNDNLSAATVKVIPELDAQIIQLSIAADQGSASSVNGVALADGTSKSWSTVGNGGDVGVRFVEPKIVLGSTDGNASYIYTKF